MTEQDSNTTQDTTAPVDEADITTTYAIYREERREDTGLLLAPQFIALREYTDRELLEIGTERERPRYSYPVAVMEEAHSDNPDIYGPGLYWVVKLPPDDADEWDKRYMTMQKVTIRAHTSVTGW